MSNFFIYIPQKDKRDHIRFLFQMICKFENIDGDEFDVYPRGCRWFGQVRKWYGVGNSKWTEIVAEYKILYCDNEMRIIKIK